MVKMKLFLHLIQLFIFFSASFGYPGTDTHLCFFISGFDVYTKSCMRCCEKDCCEADISGKTVAIILCCSLGIPLVITAVCIGVCLWLKRRRRAACPALVEARNRESQDQLAAISFCSAMERHQTTTPVSETRTASLADHPPSYSTYLSNVNADPPRYEEVVKYHSTIKSSNEK